MYPYTWLLADDFKTLNIAPSRRHFASPHTVPDRTRWYSESRDEARKITRCRLYAGRKRMRHDIRITIWRASGERKKICEDISVFGAIYGARITTRTHEGRRKREWHWACLITLIAGLFLPSWLSQYGSVRYVVQCNAHANDRVYMYLHPVYAHTPGTYAYTCARCPRSCRNFLLAKDNRTIC